jgi:hypothetical protein
VLTAARNLWISALARVDQRFAQRVQLGRYLFGEDMREIRADRIGYGYITDYVR